MIPLQDVPVIKGSEGLYQPTPRFDLLHAPLLGRLLRWRWGRLVFQIPLLLVALLMVYDGLTGRRLLPKTWRH